MSYPSSPNPRPNLSRDGGDEEARLTERNRKCRKDDGRRRRSDLTSPSQRGEAGGRSRENLNSFISPRRLEQQPPQRSINTCTFKVLKWSVRCYTASVEKRRSVSAEKQHTSKTPGQEENVRMEGFLIFSADVVWKPSTFVLI